LEQLSEDILGEIIFKGKNNIPSSAILNLDF